MFSAVTIAEKLSLKVANDLKLDEEKKQVIEYGIFSIVQMIFNLILVLLIGFIFNVAIEALIVSLTVGVLRKSSGGAHSSSPNTCIVVGTMVCVVIGLVSKFQVGIY
ncbi:MAG: accessory gene regulator B family protein, partial [Clostridium sp.]